jgi:riboflavin synthase
MFTGIIQATGTIVDVAPSAAGVRIGVDTGDWTHAAEAGESIAVDGCCLTVAAREGRVLVFDAIHETLAKTTLGEKRAGDRVHLEHAATPDTLLGGHVVQGHVDGVGEVAGVSRDADVRIRFALPRELMRFVSPKGSICVDGVSLTVAGLGEGWFEVALIPTTLGVTGLGGLEVGGRVNVEMDAISKMVVHYLEHFKS